MSELPKSGGCQCGALRYEISATPLDTYVCHCRECQHQSASAFGISVIVLEEAFRLVQGKPEVWSRPSDSGRTVDCYFCANCGSRVWHHRRGFSTLSVKGGSFEQIVDLGDATHIWTSRKLRGILIPEGAKQFPAEPPQ